jgi:hypothetical protein
MQEGSKKVKEERMPEKYEEEMRERSEGWIIEGFEEREKREGKREKYMKKRQRKEIV